MTDVVTDPSRVMYDGGGQTMLAPQEVHRMLALQAQGWGAKRISKELGCSRNTVREYLRSGGWRPMDVSGRSSLLAPHLAWLEQRLRQHKGNADVVRQELQREFGIAVSLRTVQRAVAPMRVALRAQAVAHVRFETAPGLQLQVDFGSTHVQVGEELTRVFVHAPAAGSRGGRRGARRRGAGSHQGMGLVVVLCFFVLAIQLFITLIEFKLTTLAGFVLVPFALWNKTSFLAEKVLGNVVASGIKVLVLAVIVGIGSGLFSQFQVHPAEPNIDHALVIMLASLTLLALGIFGPGIATGLVSGAPQLGAGAMAGAAIGAAGAAVAVGAAATGVGGAVMAGAHGAGCRQAGRQRRACRHVGGWQREVGVPGRLCHRRRWCERRDGGTWQRRQGGRAGRRTGSSVPRLRSRTEDGRPLPRRMERLGSWQRREQGIQPSRSRRQGSRILGRYNSQVSYGQSRVQVVWNRIILPDTSSLTLDNLIGTDPAGYSGLEDGVDYHWNRIVAGAVLTTLLGVGAELAAPENRQDDNRIVIAGRDSAQDSINQVGQEMTRRSMNIQPTLTERPGLPVRIIVNRDLVLRPYQPLFFNRGTLQ